MADLKRQFGASLKAHRISQRLTQEDLAESLGVTADFVSQVERGINAPSFEVLSRISEVLHLPVRDLFDFTTKHSPRARAIAPRQSRPKRP